MMPIIEATGCKSAGCHPEQASQRRKASVDQHSHRVRDRQLKALPIYWSKPVLPLSKNHTLFAKNHAFHGAGLPLFAIC